MKCLTRRTVQLSMFTAAILGATASLKAADKITTAVQSVNANSAVYAKKNGQTFCNWFVADVAAELRLSKNAIPRSKKDYPHRTGVKMPKLANTLYKHFVAEDAKHRRSKTGDWKKVNSAGAAAAANRGQFVVASKHKSGHGHIAVVLSSSRATAIRIAQAGNTCTNDGPVAGGFASNSQSYFVYLGK